MCCKVLCPCYFLPHGFFNFSLGVDISLVPPNHYYLCKSGITCHRVHGTAGQSKGELLDMWFTNLSEEGIFLLVFFFWIEDICVFFFIIFVPSFLSKQILRSIRSIHRTDNNQIKVTISLYVGLENHCLTCVERVNSCEDVSVVWNTSC